MAARPVAPFGLGRPVDAHHRRGADERQHDRFVGLLGGVAVGFFSAGTSVAAISGWRFTFTPACGIGTRQRLTGACGAWNDTLFWPGVRVIALAYSRCQLDLLGLLAFLLDQQPVALAGRADDPRRLAAKRGAGDGGVGQPQGDLVPALGQHLDLHLGLHADHVLLDGRLVFDLGNQRADGRLRLGRGPRLVLGRLPQFLELLVGQEHPAALLLEDLPQLLVGDVDVLLADLAIGFFGRARGILGARRFLGQRAQRHQPYCDHKDRRERADSKSDHHGCVLANEKGPYRERPQRGAAHAATPPLEASLRANAVAYRDIIAAITVYPLDAFPPKKVPVVFSQPLLCHPDRSEGSRAAPDSSLRSERPHFAFREQPLLGLTTREERGTFGVGV